MDRRRFALLGLLMVAGCPSNPVPRDTGNDAPARDTPMDTPATDTCGNGALDTGEECDGAQLDGETCITQGYDGGTLGCTDECTFDKTMCERTCGNGAIDGGEDCDGTNLNGGTCAGEGFASGELSCNGDCTYNTTGCSSCGNGSVDAGESCDGTAFGGATCVSLGFTGGTLDCTDTCTIDTAACTDTNCGNGVRDAGEDCDGTAFGGNSCLAFGFASGTLGCNADCTANTAACSNCGNGVVNGAEACDGADLNGQSCTTQGFTGGTLTCTASCTLNTGACVNTACGNGVVEAGEACDDGNGSTGDGCAACAVETGYACTGAPSSCDPVCGDGAIVGGEACDGTNLAGRTCTSLGYVGGGTLSCSSTTCAFVTTGCFSGTCGNGVLNPGEECDDTNNVSFDGCSATCTVDPTYDLPVRLSGGAGSNIGRIEVWQEGAWRDVCDDGHEGAPHTNALANVVCRQLGFTGTGHRVIGAYGGGSATPVMDNLSCTGSEVNLSQCDFAGWGNENCDGSESLGIECIPGEGDIRLVGAAHGDEGRLQFFHGAAWGEVCDDWIDMPITGYGADTVCTELGYASGTIYDTTAPSDVFLLDDVRCSGTERRIASCPHSALTVENCSAIEGVGVRCSVYGEGDARVTGSTGRNTGRVEVLHDSIWTTVCDDIVESSTPAATGFVHTVCTDLGYPGTGSVSTTVTAGGDPILLDNVQCVGTETSLLMCPANPLFDHNCVHAEDVGVICTP